MKTIPVTCDYRPQNQSDSPFIAVGWAKGRSHSLYEDSYRMLTRDIPVVAQKSRGEIFAVFDGIGSAPKGQQAAQYMGERLTDFFRNDSVFLPTEQGLFELLMTSNHEINAWGTLPGREAPLGGCAGTVCWLQGDMLTLFHAGDTLGLHVCGEDIRTLTEKHNTMGGALSRYFGMGSSLTLQSVQFQVEEGDQIILLSDGITKGLPYPEVIVRELNEYPQLCQAVSHLVRRAQQKGSDDDLTVLFYELDEIWEP